MNNVEEKEAPLCKINVEINEVRKVCFTYTVEMENVHCIIFIIEKTKSKVSNINVSKEESTTNSVMFSC